MLLTMIEVVCCENTKCKEFGRIAPNPHRLKSYYCPVCGKVSAMRIVDANLADSPDRFRAHVLERVQPAQSESPVSAHPHDLAAF
jgi:hypothetical protein